MKKVLVVDDASFMRIMIKNILQNHGFEVAGEAEDGNAALVKYKELQPDIVTMDITMPKKTGLEALKDIIEYDKDAKVIMLTAMGQQNMVIDAINLGAKSFIVKPFKEETVIKTINSFLLN